MRLALEEDSQYLYTTRYERLRDERYVRSIGFDLQVRYLVRSEDAERMALALQISNLLVRSMFCSRLGMADLPESVAYFSGVDIDRIMRKDPQSECITPSNPQGLLHGHGIEPGRTMTIGEIIQEVGPRLL